MNVRDSSMMTPLMWAAFHARPEQVKVLKENGAGQLTQFTIYGNKKLAILTIHLQIHHWQILMGCVPFIGQYTDTRLERLRYKI